MKLRLRRLFEPAQTSPADFSFAWTDGRPKRAQVMSGLRIVGGMLAGFLVLVCGLLGLGLVSGDQRAQSESTVFVLWALLVVAAIVMLWTANRWAPFVSGFFFGPAVLRILATLVFESDSYYSAHSTSRTEVAEFLAFCVAAIALTARFVGRRPAPTTVFDRFALTFFVFAVLKQILSPNGSLKWPLLLGGVALLLAAWCADRLTGRKRRRKRHMRGPEAA